MFCKLFLRVQWVGLQYLIVVFPDLTHLLFVLEQTLCHKMSWAARPSLQFTLAFVFSNFVAEFVYFKVGFYEIIMESYSVSARPEFLGVIDDPLFENLGVIGKFRGSELF